MKLLKFEASWCQPCKQLSKTMESMEFPFPVAKVDIDTDRDAAITYGIRGVPTLLLMDENDNILLRLTGALTKAKLEEELEPFLGTN